LITITLLFPIRLESAEIKSGSEAIKLLEQGGEGAISACNYLVKLPPELRRPTSIMFLAKRSAPKNSKCNREGTFDLCVNTLGIWKAREAIGFLIEHMNIRYSDFTFGPRRSREFEATDDYFPCLIALRRIGDPSINSLADFALITNSTLKRKLALSCLVRIRGKEESIKTIKMMEPVEDAENHSACRKIILELKGDWIFEKEPEKEIDSGEEIKDESEREKMCIFGPVQNLRSESAEFSKNEDEWFEVGRALDHSIKFDRKGHIIEYASRNPDGIIERKVSTYDDKAKLITRSIYNSKSSIIHRLWR
jgi:hypothetical protein